MCFRWPCQPKEPALFSTETTSKVSPVKKEEKEGGEKEGLKLNVSTAARAFKNMSGKVEVMRFNRDESNINIEFSDLMAAQKYEKKCARLSY